MKKYYSDKINYYSKMINNEIIIPDIIMVKDGISCGDRILLSLELDDDILSFSFSCDNCCELCKSACNYIEFNYNHKNIKKVIKSINTIIKNTNKENKYLFNLFDLDYDKYYMRKDCLLSPFEFFISSIHELENVDYTYGLKPDTLSTLACDACVGTCRINWEQKETIKKDHHNGKVYSTKYLEKWIPFGKVELNKEEIIRLKDAITNITDEDFQFLSDYTMNGFVLEHVLKYYPDLIDKRWKAPAYLIQKNEINKSYFEKVKDYIIENKLNIYSVKGYVTQKYYENPMIRVHSDYDLIASTSSDAFKLTNFLLKEGFTIRPNLFSYKKMDYKSSEKVSGHFHVQKIIDDMYMFELDITFPAFPINRVDLFYPNVIDNDICVEGQIIITLLHLFKHEHVYIKDINDIFYMLKDKIDYDYLYSLLNEYKLLKFFNLAVSYINKNYSSFNSYYKVLSNKFNLDDNILNKYPNWPYDLDMHLKVKKEDLDNRLETSKEYERKYLFPVVIFKDLINLSNIKDNILKKYNIHRIEESIYEINYKGYVFYLTPIGLFIDNYIDTKTKTRLKYIEIIKSFINDINIKDVFNVTYAYTHFYVRVV